MAAELEGILDIAGTSPEAQWRCQILIQSAKDADSDIKLQLDKLSQRHTHGPKVAAVCKLQRDAGRARQHFLHMLQKHERRQQAEISFLSRQNDEDFFEKAMRERDAEVKQIHTSMKQVNAIYQDLAELVDNQQEQINHIDQATDDAKANARDGLKNIQATIFGLCQGKGHTDDDVQRNLAAQRNDAEEGYRVGEDFDWNMPFETLGKDFQSVQADVVRFGQGLWDELQVNVAEGRLSGCAGDLCEAVTDEQTNKPSCEREEKNKEHRSRKQRKSSRRNRR
jgi:hypothetical protein